MAFGDWEDNLGLGPLGQPSFLPGIGMVSPVRKIAGPLPAPPAWHELGPIPSPITPQQPPSPPIYAQPIKAAPLPPIQSDSRPNTPEFPSLGEQRANRAAAESERLKDTGPGWSQVGNPFLRGLARFGDIAGTILAPGITSRIPGTTLHNDILQAQARGEEAQGVKEQGEEANTAVNQARVPEVEAQTEEAQARADTLRDALEHPATPQPKAIGAYTNADGKHVVIFQDPNGLTHEQIYGDVNQKENQTEQQKDYQQFLKDNNLPDTAANKNAFLRQRKEAVHITVNGGGAEDFKHKQAALKIAEPALGADFRLVQMRKNEQDALKGDQQAMLSLLTNHIGMTLGLQKGARITRDILREAEQSTPWLQGLIAHFDDRGYLSGVALTPQQMRQMVNLAEDQDENAWNRANSEAKYLGVDLPERIASPRQQQQSGPKAGDVIDGYKFKGGNPADKANWEKQ